MGCLHRRRCYSTLETSHVIPHKCTFNRSICMCAFKYVSTAAATSRCSPTEEISPTQFYNVTFTTQTGKRLLFFVPNIFLDTFSLSQHRFTSNSLNSDQIFRNKVPLTEVTSTPTRPVDNVVITTKGLQERNNNCLMEGRWKI